MADIDAIDSSLIEDFYEKDLSTESGDTWILISKKAGHFTGPFIGIFRRLYKSYNGRSAEAIHATVTNNVR